METSRVSGQMVLRLLDRPIGPLVAGQMGSRLLGRPIGRIKRTAKIITIGGGKGTAPPKFEII